MPSGEQPPSPTFDQVLSHALWQAHHLTEQALDAALAPLGLSTTLLGALGFAARHPGLSTADLARLARVRPQSASHAVARLEQAGLLTRTPHPVHGRVMQLTVTQEGHQALGRGEAAAAQVEQSLLATVPAEARQELLHHLNQIRVQAEHQLTRQ
jgi:DNA-binding MarR family transcriptional regulator